MENQEKLNVPKDIQDDADKLYPIVLGDEAYNRGKDINLGFRTDYIKGRTDERAKSTGGKWSDKDLLEFAYKCGHNGYDPLVLMYTQYNPDYVHT